MISRRDERLWAKEEIVDAIDKMIAHKRESADGLSLDEEVILRKERNRVVKFLGLDNLIPKR